MNGQPRTPDHDLDGGRSPVSGTASPEFEKLRQKQQAPVKAAHDALHDAITLRGKARSGLDDATEALTTVEEDVDTQNRIRDARLRRDSFGAGTWPVRLLSAAAAVAVAYIIYNVHKAVVSTFAIASYTVFIIVIGLSIYAALGGWMTGTFGKERWATRTVNEQDAVRLKAPIYLFGVFIAVETLLNIARGLNSTELLRPLIYWSEAVALFLIDALLAFVAAAPYKQDVKKNQVRLAKARATKGEAEERESKAHGDVNVATDRYITTAGHAADAIQTTVDGMAKVDERVPGTYSYPVDVERLRRVSKSDLSFCDVCVPPQDVADRAGDGTGASSGEDALDLTDGTGDGGGGDDVDLHKGPIEPAGPSGLRTVTPLSSLEGVASTNNNHSTVTGAAPE